MYADTGNKYILFSQTEIEELSNIYNKLVKKKRKAPGATGITYMYEHVKYGGKP